jgi:hypothetical protein
LLKRGVPNVGAKANVRGRSQATHIRVLPGLMLHDRTRMTGHQLPVMRATPSPMHDIIL